MATKKKVLMSTDATLRDYFAANAISNTINETPVNLKNWFKKILGMGYKSYEVDIYENTKRSYQIADEMIKQRSLK